MCVDVPDFWYGKVLDGLENVLDNSWWHSGYCRGQGFDQEVV